MERVDKPIKSDLYSTLMQSKCIHKLQYNTKRSLNSVYHNGNFLKSNFLINNSSQKLKDNDILDTSNVKYSNFGSSNVKKQDFPDTLRNLSDRNKICLRKDHMNARMRNPHMLINNMSTDPDSMSKLAYSKYDKLPRISDYKYKKVSSESKSFKQLYYKEIELNTIDTYQGCKTSEYFPLLNHYVSYLKTLNKKGRTTLGNHYSLTSSSCYINTNGSLKLSEYSNLDEDHINELKNLRSTIEAVHNTVKAVTHALKENKPLHITQHDMLSEIAGKVYKTFIYKSHLNKVVGEEEVLSTFNSHIINYLKIVNKPEFCTIQTSIDCATVRKYDDAAFSSEDEKVINKRKKNIVPSKKDEGVKINKIFKIKPKIDPQKGETDDCQDKSNNKSDSEDDVFLKEEESNVKFVGMPGSKKFEKLENNHIQKGKDARKPNIHKRKKAIVKILEEDKLKAFEDLLENQVATKKIANKGRMQIANEIKSIDLFRNVSPASSFISNNSAPENDSIQSSSLKASTPHKQRKRSVNFESKIDKTKLKQIAAISNLGNKIGIIDEVSNPNSVINRIKEIVTKPSSKLEKLLVKKLLQQYLESNDANQEIIQNELIPNKIKACEDSSIISIEDASKLDQILKKLDYARSAKGNIRNSIIDSIESTKVFDTIETKFGARNNSKLTPQELDITINARSNNKSNNNLSNQSERLENNQSLMQNSENDKNKVKIEISAYNEKFDKSRQQSLSPSRKNSKDLYNFSELNLNVNNNLSVIPLRKYSEKNQAKDQISINNPKSKELFGAKSTTKPQTIPKKKIELAVAKQTKAKPNNAIKKNNSNNNKVNLIKENSSKEKPLNKSRNDEFLTKISVLDDIGNDNKVNILDSNEIYNSEYLKKLNCQEMNSGELEIIISSSGSPLKKFEENDSNEGVGDLNPNLIAPLSKTTNRGSICNFLKGNESKTRIKSKDSLIFKFEIRENECYDPQGNEIPNEKNTLASNAAGAQNKNNLRGYRNPNLQRSTIKSKESTIKDIEDQPIYSSNVNTYKAKIVMPILNFTEKDEHSKYNTIEATDKNRSLLRPVTDEEK